MKTIGERLTYLIESQYSSKTKFCEENGLEYNSFQPFTNNKRTLGIHLLNKLVEVFPNLNVNWLLYGKGKININDDESSLSFWNMLVIHQKKIIYLEKILNPQKNSYHLKRYQTTGGK